MGPLPEAPESSATIAQAPPGPRATRPRGEQRRQEVIAAARDLFAARGFNSVSLAEIAAHVGLTQAGVLHHFPSKAALLTAVLQDREERNAVHDEARAAAGMDVVETFLATLRDNERNPELVQLFALLSAEGLSAENPGHDWWAERYRRTVAEMTAQLDDLVDADRLPEGVDVETIARWLIGLADGLRMQALLVPGSVNRSDSVAAFVRVLGSCLSLRTAATGA